LKKYDVKLKKYNVKTKEKPCTWITGKTPQKLPRNLTLVNVNFNMRFLNYLC